MNKCIACIILLFLFPVSAHAWQGTVTRVIDGDTIDVQRNGSRERVRLYGIDAPEKAQPHGTRATRYLSRLLHGQKVAIDKVAEDRYGRIVAMVFLSDGSNVNQLLLQNGTSWVYPAYCKKKICRQWSYIEETARTEKRGLWADNNPVPPWEWRKKEDSLLERIC